MAKPDKHCLKLWWEYKVYGIEQFCTFEGKSTTTNIVNFQKILEQEYGEINSKEDYFTALNLVVNKYILRVVKNKEFIKVTTNTGSNNNDIITDYLIDILHIQFLMISLDKEQRGKLFSELNKIVRQLHKQVTHAEYIIFCRKFLLFPIEEPTVKTIIKDTLFSLNCTYDERIIKGVTDKGKIIFQNTSIDVYGVKFEGIIDAISTLLSSIIQLPGVITSFRSNTPSLMCKHGNKNKMDEITKRISKGIIKVNDVLGYIASTSIVSLWGLRIYLNEETVNNVPEYNLKRHLEYDYDNRQQDEIILKMFDIVTYRPTLPQDVLYNRDFITPKEGIIIRHKEQLDNLDYVFIKEVHDFNVDSHKIYVRYVCTDEVEKEFMLDIDSISLNLDSIEIERDVIIFLMVMYTFDLLTKLKEDLKDKIYNWSNKTIDNTEIKYVLDLVKNILNHMESDFRNNLYYEQPYYWNYSNNNKGDNSNNSNNNKVFVRKKKKINMFSKKLPEGFHPSEDAIEYAQAYRFNLEKGKTIVRSHERTVNIRLDK